MSQPTTQLHGDPAAVSARAPVGPTAAPDAPGATRLPLRRRGWGWAAALVLVGVGVVLVHLADLDARSQAALVVVIVLIAVYQACSWRLVQAEREHVERVLDAAGDGLYAVDGSGRVTSVSQALCELVGLDRVAVQGLDHHAALGHREADGTPVSREDCPLCAPSGDGLVSRKGQAALSGPSTGVVPVEYAVRVVRDHNRERVITVRDLREQRALEDRRRQAEAERDQLASLAEAAPDLAIVGRSDGTLVWMNAAGRTLLGFEPTEDIGAYRIEDVFSAEEMARIYAEDMPLVARDHDWQGEWTLQTRLGDQVPAWVTQHLHPGVGGELAYVSGIMRDLRPQRAVELARRASERRLAIAEGVAGLGSWEWDLSSDSVFWSPGMYRLHGLELGSGVEDVAAWAGTVHPDDRERTMAEVERARTHLDGIDFNYRAVLHDGRTLVIHSRGRMVGTEHGSMIGTLLDITDRHAAAEALRESEQRARLVVETAGDAYVQLGDDGCVAEWNDAAEETFGWTRQEALGRAFTALVLAPADREPFERHVGLHTPPSEHGPRERFELTMRHRWGREIPAEVTAWTIETAGTPVFSCFVRDIGDRQATERAKNEFVSVVGHELRTPLTSIHGALGLLRAGLLGDLTERGQHMVDIAAHNTDRLVRLINDILDIERLSSGTVSLQQQDCDLAVLAGRSVESMRPMADAAGVTLGVDSPPTWVRADADRIEQMLTNLLSNAIKFSPPGSAVRVVVESQVDQVRVQVRDQGRGIPPEHLELVFDRFQQVDGSDAREKGGTGLGLAICRTIVEQHGGRIWAESGPEGGATLTFTLPVQSAYEEPLALRDHGDVAVVQLLDDLRTPTEEHASVRL